MSTSHYSEDEYLKAKKRVKAKKGFYWHLATFVIVNGFLFLINLLTSPGDWWYLFPLISWGVSLVFHFIAVFGIPGLNFNNKEWEEKEIDKELRKRAPEAPLPTEPDEELELKEFRKLRNDWKDSDFV